MNKFERLHSLLFFLKDKKRFQLHTIMQAYNISKSTALRDIAALEQMGMPLYAEHGRAGHYQILPNTLLSPILFRIDEIQALYFAMNTLGAYASTPFHIHLEELKQKFEQCLSQDSLEKLNKMEQVFRFASIEQHRACPLLREILEQTLNEQVCTIEYKKKQKTKSYTIQFIEISSAFGQWYVTAYDFESTFLRVFRCDRILSLNPSTTYPSLEKNILEPSPYVRYRKQDAIDFQIEITESAMDIFYKENYPSMQLLQRDGRYYIQGYYHKGEENFLCDYLLRFSTTILHIEPLQLKNLMQKRMREIAEHLFSI